MIQKKNYTDIEIKLESNSELSIDTSESEFTLIIHLKTTLNSQIQW